jgi:hypothetical protein
MAKKVTTKGALQAAVDTFLLAFYAMAGIAGIMIASVLRDLTLWFYFGAGVFLLFTSIKLVSKVTKPMDNYETQEVS